MIKIFLCLIIIWTSLENGNYGDQGKASVVFGVLAVKNEKFHLRRLTKSAIYTNMKK